MLLIPLTNFLCGPHKYLRTWDRFNVASEFHPLPFDFVEERLLLGLLALLPVVALPCSLKLQQLFRSIKPIRVWNVGPLDLFILLDYDLLLWVEHVSQLIFISHPPLSSSWLQMRKLVYVLEIPLLRWE